MFNASQARQKKVKENVNGYRNYRNQINSIQMQVFLAGARALFTALFVKHVGSSHKVHILHIDRYICFWACKVKFSVGRAYFTQI